MAKEKQGFQFKPFTSFLLFFSFLGLSVTGIILFISPAGRVANWTDWNVWGLSKTEWTRLHLAFMVIMLIPGIFHLFWFNWRIFWSYLKTKASRGVRYKWEFGASVLLTLVLIFGMLGQIPPVISLADLSDWVSESWEENKKNAPVSHAELLTLEEYAATIKVPIESVIEILKKKGYTPAGPNQVLQELAAQYKVAPSDLDALFKEDPETAQARSSVSGGGAGYGKMKFSDLIESLGLTREEALKRLKDAGITGVEDRQTLKEIGEANGKGPKDILGILSPEQAGEH